MDPFCRTIRQSVSSASADATHSTLQSAIPLLDAILTLPPVPRPLAPSPTLSIPELSIVHSPTLPQCAR